MSFRCEKGRIGIVNAGIKKTKKNTFATITKGRLCLHPQDTGRSQAFIIQCSIEFWNRRIGNPLVQTVFFSWHMYYAKPSAKKLGAILTVIFQEILCIRLNRDNKICINIRKYHIFDCISGHRITFLICICCHRQRVKAADSSDLSGN